MTRAQEIVVAVDCLVGAGLLVWWPVRLGRVVMKALRGTARGNEQARGVIGDCECREVAVVRCSDFKQLVDVKYVDGKVT